jgi:hypothetical protein
LSTGSENTVEASNAMTENEATAEAFDIFQGEDDDGYDVDDEVPTTPMLGRQGTERVIVQPFNVAQTGSTVRYTATKPHEQRKEKKGKRAPTRCRTCGHYVTDPNWAPFHREKRGFKVGSAKRSRNCTVPESDRKEGFPWPKGKRMPSNT